MHEARIWLSLFILASNSGGCPRMKEKVETGHYVRGTWNKLNHLKCRYTDVNGSMGWSTGLVHRVYAAVLGYCVPTPQTSFCEPHLHLHGMIHDAGTWEAPEWGSGTGRGGDSLG
ncbi:hypothetical protein P152DRAFT_460273 [Eremomyces bilateralis CBS 781.70]|uniref:Secreted protein n=1 Tax=Eremomyces bilateralis CBS 781.70 TaxID=1392243 RepID=A0A6G1FXU6_9PEZI|nr:uncharacterized protein P152DRAFT_460273 [Eremomyces bilateralis CBS 781.70]KAF1810578.1 hypothetical protein P152DRAFT_460273 [Eremomyces bilateralis CBS 781.70]